MYYTINKLMNKLKRSKDFCMLCINRYSINKIRLKTTHLLVYDIPKEKMEQIIIFNNQRIRREYKNRNRKNNK